MEVYFLFSFLRGKKLKSMKNKFIMLTIILMILLGAGLLELNLHWLGFSFLGLGSILFIMFPILCGLINDKL